MDKEKPRRVTIRDVAKASGVSHATVSRALHNRDEISLETRERIQALAKAMHYVPDARARNLVTNRSDCLGVIVPDIANGYFTNIISGIEDCASENNRHVILGQSRYNGQLEDTIVKEVLQHRVDGLIICPSSIEAMERICQISRGVRIVFICANSSDLGVPFVAVDDQKAGRVATEYLLGLGHRHICFLGADTTSDSVVRRLEGFRTSMDAGLGEKRPQIVPCGLQRNDGYSATVELIRSGAMPEAILACNDEVAIGALLAMAEHGIATPEDVSVIGFDDIELSCLPQISLTTMAVPHYEMGRKAAEILLQDQRYAEEAGKILVEASLKIRKTCQVARCRRKI